ncbi:MAG: 2-hydroxyacyl-CoA dehydratase family protein, partial [candidate division WOR-3 bacterium]
ITRQRLRWAIKETNRQRHIIKKLMNLMKLMAPPLTGLELLKTIAFITSTPGELDKFEKAINEMMERKITPPASQRKRVILTGISIPKFGEKIIEIIENNGGLVVARDNCTGIISFLDDINADVDDPILVLAEKYKHAPCPMQKTVNRQTIMLDNMRNDFSPDCVIEVVWQACGIYSAASQFLSDHIQNTLKLPYYRIEVASSMNTRKIAVQIRKFLSSLPK